MEVLTPEKALDIEGFLDPFNDLYYDMDWNTTTELRPFEMDICDVAKPVYPGAQITTLIFSVIGILINFSVLFVMLILKEYKKSRIYWFFLQIMASNIIFLTCVSFQMGNELNRKWATGNASCKMNEASLFSSHASGITFLTIANICGLLSHLKVIFSWFPSFQCQKIEPVKSIFLIVLVWLPCCLINLPLYKFSTINHCGHCHLEFPLDEEFCDLIGINKTQCMDLLNMIYSDDGNSTAEADDLYIPDDFFSTGDESTDGWNEYDGSEHFSYLETLACRFEEPGTFYLWLNASFGLFYVTPLPIFAFFIAFYIYDRKKRGTADKNKNQDIPVHIIIVLDVFFFVFCTPWNVVKMRKANGGIGSGDGKSCANVVNYARLSTILFYILMPCVYGYFTKRFRNRVMTSVATAIHFFYRCCGWFTKKNTIVTSEKTEMKLSSSECDVEGDTDVTNDIEIEKPIRGKQAPLTDI